VGNQEAKLESFPYRSFDLFLKGEELKVMIIDKLLASLNMVLNLVLPLILTLVYALALLLIGWIIARVLQWVVAYVLKALQLDKGCQTVGLTPLLTKGEIKRAPSDLIGDLIYWLTIVIVVVAAADFLGLRGATRLISGVLAYIPSLISAVVILAVSVLLAVLASALVILVANNLGLAYAKSISRFIKYTVIIFGVIVALGLLGIPASYIMKESSLVVGMVALAAAIAFGLGCKDIAGDFITNLFKQR
jgi:small-conductance mechanosensitive channel